MNSLSAQSHLKLQHCVQTNHRVQCVKCVLQSKVQNMHLNRALEFKEYRIKIYRYNSDEASLL